MSQRLEKYTSTIDTAVAQMLSRAANSRGLEAGSVRPRIAAAIEKYLFVDGSSPDHADIKQFVDEIRSDDLCLIIACEQGDETAWEDLVAGYDSTVKSAARKITSNTEDAEDLASSIWAELYGLRVDSEGKKKSKLAYYSGRGSLGGWLRAVVAQLAVDQHRKVSKFVQVEEDREFENLANEAASDGNSLTSHTANPEDAFTDEQTSGDVSEALAAAITGLEPEDRLVMKLYYFDSLKLRDIASMFGYHEATASRRLTRIQADIRKMVEKELKNKHGWTDTEVKRHLSDTAASLGMSLEAMFAVLTFAILVQDFWR